jgi:hypothetical protein
VSVLVRTNRFADLAARQGLALVTSGQRPGAGVLVEGLWANAVGQQLLILKTHADSQRDPGSGRMLPGRSYRVVPTEPADAASMEYTRQALVATGYYIDREFWDGEAKSCCPPKPGSQKGSLTDAH